MILYGADYYPEQWNEDLMDEDLDLMETMSVNMVTLGVFSWDKMEPKAGIYDLDWLEEVIHRLWERNISVCLATPTSAPPFWMTNDCPDMMRVTVEGIRMKPGARANFCPNHPAYRSASAGVVEALARRFGYHPALKLWHINNEYEFYCYCPECAKAFRVFLSEKYGTIENLNRCWCTDFWSHTYPNFDLIDPPSYLNEIKAHMLCDRDIACFQAMDIDYRRFMSQSIVHLISEEARILRKYSDAPITNNFAGLHKTFDLRVLGEPLDVIGWDNYPTIKTPLWETAFTHDLMRTIKSKPFLTMEQTPNHILWRDYLPCKRPGEVSRLAWQGVAHGSNANLFFQWRQSRGGVEMLHGAMVPHSGRIDTRMGKELTRLGSDFKRLGGTLDAAMPKPKAALVFTWESWWALESSSIYNNAIRYEQAVLAYYRALWELGIDVDVIDTKDDLSPYNLVAAPFLYLCSGVFAQVLTEFVRAGGVAISSCLSGIVDENVSAVLGGYPGYLRPLFGLWVEETDGLYPDMKNHVAYEGHVYKAEKVCDLIRLEGAQALAEYTTDFYRNTPCVTEHALGKGRALYVGSMVEHALLKTLLERALAYAGLPISNLPDGLEKTRRGKFTCLINHSDRPMTVLAQGCMHSLLTGRRFLKEILLESGETEILAIEKTRET